MRMFTAEARKLVKTSSSIGSDNYPETMNRMFIINAPFMFRAAWSVIKGFLDKKTIAKISIHGDNYTTELFEVVDPDNVPEYLGGNCTCEHLEGGCSS